MGGTKTERFDKVLVGSAEELRDWLAANHTREDGVWLVTFKKHVPAKFVSTEQVLDELLAFGGVDGVRRKLDDDRTMQLVSPRKTQAWAKSYKDRAERLIAEGRMAAPGFAAIEASKRNGLWDYWADVDALIVPADLREALSMVPNAAAAFDGSAPSYRRNLLRWVKLAKTEATRTKRIAQIVDASGKGDRIPQM